MKNSETNTYNYKDNVWEDVEKTLHENNFSHNNKFIGFKFFVSCKENDDIEKSVYKDEHELCVVLHTFLGVKTLYVHVAGEMICNIIRENLSSRYDIHCTPDTKIKNVTKTFVSGYYNMAYRYQLQQPRPMMESEMVKHKKYVPHEEKTNIYNVITYKKQLNEC